MLDQSEFRPVNIEIIVHEGKCSPHKKAKYTKLQLKFL